MQKSNNKIDSEKTEENDDSGSGNEEFYDDDSESNFVLRDQKIANRCQNFPKF